MEEEHSNGRRAFQWKKSIPMEEENSNGSGMKKEFLTERKESKL